MYAKIAAIEYYLPQTTLSNEELATLFPEWSADRIEEKLGITTRHIAAADEYASNLAVNAAKKLFNSGACTPEEIDFILLCTQSPDYPLPTTACLVQHELGIPETVGALDINLGCSGFIYALSLAKGLIESGQAKNILLITTDTYTKYLNAEDKTTRTLFGDGAAATLITVSDQPCISSFVFGTDGAGAKNLIVTGGGMRDRKPSDLYMNGPEIFTFTLFQVPKLVQKLLQKTGRKQSDIDLFVFHQASRYLLESLRKKIKIDETKFYYGMQECGNTVSSSIPIALKNAHDEGKLNSGQKIMLVGFGVGYSMGAVLVES